MDQEQFEAWWPEVSRRLDATLTRRGVRPADAADIVQETALRTLARWPDVDDVEAFTRWAHTVAWRQCIDAYRRTRGTTTVSFGAVHDQTTPDRWDSDRVVEGKLELERTLRAMASLSTSDQAALAAAISGPASTAIDRKQAVREAVRLHRARLRLAGVVTKMGAALGVSWKGLRKLAQLEAPRTTAVVATAVFVGAMTISFDGGGVDLRQKQDEKPTEVAPPASEQAAAPVTTEPMLAAVSIRAATAAQGPPPTTPARTPPPPPPPPPEPPKGGLNIVPPTPPPPSSRGYHSTGPVRLGWDTGQDPVDILFPRCAQATVPQCGPAKTIKGL